jgi:ornithine cyclodeaminase/alanine dehydrogenase-like protein (mu-crystallin family)
MQAAYQIEALAVVRSISAVRVHDRDLRRAQAFAADLALRVRGPVSVAEDWPAAARSADIVVTCTPSKSPVLGADDLSSGAFLAAVGADHPEKNEVDPSLLARSRVFVDSLAQAAIMGDLHHALERGVMRLGEVQGELWEVVAGRKTGRASDDEVTIFDSTGVAIEDVASAALAYERAEDAGRGYRFDLRA